MLLVSSVTIATGFFFITMKTMQSLRKDLQNHSIAYARLLGQNAVESLEQHDTVKAVSLLKKMDNLPELSNGGLYLPDSSLFASYSPGDTNFSFPAYHKGPYRAFHDGFLHVFEPVKINGSDFGTIYLRASTQTLDNRFNSYMEMMAILAAVLLLFAYVTALWLQRYISRPIRELADLTDQVSRNGDYSLRATPFGNDELTLLYNRFNDMLEQVRQRDERSRKAETALRESESKYRILIEQIPTMTYAASLNAVSTLLFVSPQVKQLLGYSPEELTSESEIYLKALHPDDYEKAMEKFRRPMKPGEQFIAEYRMYKTDGSIVWIHDEASVVADESGNPMVLQGVMSDITSRKETEDELKSTQSYLRDVFDSLQSMLVSVSPEGDITQWNKIAEFYTGIKAEIALTRKIWEVGPLLQKYQSSIIQVLQTQAPVEHSRQPFPGDEKKFLNISIYPLTNHGRGAVIRIDDVTELEKKDSQLLQAQKLEMVGTLAGGLAHDFNNVLSGIIGSTSLIRFLLENEQIDMERFRTNIETIATSADRAADMVQQLMTISRKHELSIAPVDLNQAVRHVIRICKSTFDKSIDINAIYFPRPAMASADVAQIEQALLNLAVNASHAMTIMRKEYQNQGGILTIAVEKILIDRHFMESHPGIEEGEHWIIRVIDTGVGMDAKTISKIFDPFFTTKEKTKGTGLGLAMVYNIIHQHNGYIDVYSNPGIGTTFNILLPVLHETEAVIKKQTIKETMPRGSGTILVVDDEEIIRETAKGILELCGYSVMVANNGHEGIETFREHSQKIKAILLDMAMPKISGKETYLELKRIRPDLKVVLASGFRQDKRVQEALDLGVNEFIQKPYSMLELAKKIKSAIGS